MAVDYSSIESHLQNNQSGMNLSNSLSVEVKDSHMMNIDLTNHIQDNWHQNKAGISHWNLSQEKQ